MNNEAANLIQDLTAQGVLDNAYIRKAFEHIDRADFVPEESQISAYANIPLPIGFGQTISQPYTVAFMLDLLQPQPGDNILDIGSGSGWQTALLAYIVRQKEGGHVVGIELVRELHEQSIQNIDRYNFIKKGIVEMHCLNATNGFPDRAPYNGVIAAAALADEIPAAWREQVKPGGRIVTPLGSSIILATKNTDGSWEEKEAPGFAFVPFIPK